MFHVIQSSENTKYTEARACSILNSKYSVFSAVENCASGFINVIEFFLKQWLKSDGVEYFDIYGTTVNVLYLAENSFKQVMDLN